MASSRPVKLNSILIDKVIFMANSGFTRTYQPVWETLKIKRHITLKVAPHLVSRVKKAVFKEKDIDIVFKVENDKKQKLVTEYNSAEWLLKIKLIADPCITIRDL